MATPGQLVKVVSETTGRNEHTTSRIYEGLREAGLVPKGSRGRYGIRISTESAAKLLIAVCVMEQVREAATVVSDYADLRANHSFYYVSQQNQRSKIPVPGSSWHVVQSYFPRLAALPHDHNFLEALMALIESYVAENPTGQVSVALRGPRPGAMVSILLELQDAPNRGVGVDYQVEDESHDGPDDNSPSGDLKRTGEISDKTIRAVASLLRDE